MAKGQQLRPLRDFGLSPFELVLKNCARWSQAESDEEYELATEALRQAMHRFVNWVVTNKVTMASKTRKPWKPSTPRSPENT